MSRPTPIAGTRLFLHWPNVANVAFIEVEVTAALIGPTSGPHDRRLVGTVTPAIYNEIIAHRLLGLVPDLRPDAPTPDSSGLIKLELRIASPPMTPIGTKAAELRAWVTSLADLDPLDEELSTSNWLATSVGTPPSHTMWNHLPELSLDPDASMDATVDAVAEFLRAETADTVGDLGLDIAADVLQTWLNASELDPERALTVVARDLRPPTPLDGPATELAMAWTILLNEGVKPVMVDDGRAIVFPVEGDHGKWNAIIEQRDPETLVIYSIVPIELPEDRLIETVEFVIRLNRDLAIGSFDLDLDSAEFVVRVGVDVGSADDSAGAIRRAIHANIELLDTHLPAIAAMTSGATVAESLQLLD